jgi:putative inorganic carbon (hco3(-)) transporter
MDISTVARWATALAIFMGISRFHGYLPILATIRAPMLASVIALIAIGLEARKWRPEDLAKHWIPKLVGVLLAIALVGIPFALNRRQSLETLNESLSRTVMIATMVWAVSRTRRGLEFMMSTVCMACIAAVILALKIGRVDRDGRLAGGFGYDPNDIALVGVVAIPLSIWYILTPTRRFRPAVLLAIPLCIKVIVDSGSRGGFLAMIAVVAAFFGMSMTKAHQKLKYTGWVIALAMLAGIAAKPSFFIDKYRSITDETDYNRTSPRGRKQVWKRGIGYAVTHPIFGVGLGNFGSAEGRLAEVGKELHAQGRGWKWGAAHNSFVEVAAELGLIAGAAFIVLVFRSVYELIKLGRRQAAQGDLLPPFLAMAMVGFSAAAFFLSWSYMDLTYALLALACAALTQDRANALAGGMGPLPLPGAGPRGSRSRSFRQVPGRPLASDLPVARRNA